MGVTDGALDLTDRYQCGNIVRWASIAIAVVAYRQHSIAISAHDSECFSASGCTALAVISKERLESLGYPQPFPTPIFADSDSTRKVGSDSAALKRSAYLRRHISFMLQAAYERIVAFFRVKGRDNPADVLTKYVPKAAFFAFRRFIAGW